MPGTIAELQAADKLFKRDEEGHIFLAGVDGSPAGLAAIKDGYADESSNQPIPDFGIVVNWIEQELGGQPVQEGEVVQEGALWSPAHVIINADGTPELFLATTPVTIDNADNPALWANQGF
jgi:ABC-type sugar transport system substrate-binding protein